MRKLVGWDKDREIAYQVLLQEKQAKQTSLDEIYLLQSKKDAGEEKQYHKH